MSIHDSRPQDIRVIERIPSNYKIGTKFTYQECDWEITCSETYKGFIELDISSWCGISAGARHTYGKMKLPYLMAKCLRAGRKQPRYLTGAPYHKKGQTFGGSIMNDHEGITQIEITRPVTQKDLKMDEGDVFKHYRLGEPTNRFDTEEELIAKAKAEFLRIFEPGWTLYVERDRQIPGKNEWQYYKDVICKS